MHSSVWRVGGLDESAKFSSDMCREEMESGPKREWLSSSLNPTPPSLRMMPPLYRVQIVVKRWQNQKVLVPGTEHGMEELIR